MVKNFNRLKICSLLFALLVSTCILAVEDPINNVKLQLKWKHQFQFAGYYAAIEKGYFNDVGLNVELIEVSDNKLPEDAIFNGQAHFAVSTSDVVLMRAKGKPVVVLATIFQHSAQVLIATEASLIKNVHDLVGKKIMIEPNSADLIAYMSDEGISLNQVKSIPHSYRTDELLANKVDAMTAYITDEPYMLKEHNFDYIIISPVAGGIDFYGDVLITTEQLIKSNPKLANDFREAALKGWIYAMNHHNEIIDLIYNKYSKRHSKAHLAFEADKMQNLIRPDIIEIGYSNIGRWQRIADIYEQTNMLNTPLNVNELMYANYVKKKTNVPWKLIVIFTISFLFFGAITLFFYTLSKRLKVEIKNRKQIQHALEENKAELLISNEKLHQLMKFKEDMTSMVIHDLKTPLSTIINAKLIKDDDSYYDLIQQSGYRMLNLVQNMLSVYKYEETGIKLEKQVISLAKIINEAIDEIRFLAEEKQLEFIINKKTNSHIEVDEELVGRVFVNLLTNAIKFSPNKGKVEIQAEDIPQNKLKILVLNQGDSIPIEKQNVIFERFRQVQKEQLGNIYSTGLGLTFCKMAVEAHGGEIGVTSDPDCDVEFWFTLPKPSNEGL